jgi:hypothetical protein
MKNFTPYFLVYLTDEGAYFGYLKEGEIVAQVFFDTPEKLMNSPFKKTLEKEPFVSLVILLDTINQTYILENLETLSWLDQISFIRHQKNRDRKETSLIGSFQQSSHEQVFVSIAEEPLNPWFSVLSSLPNPLKKITTAPLEILRFAKTLSFKEPCILIQALDKKFGFRQVVLIHKNLFLTRFISVPQKGKINIKEETDKTIHYLCRQTGIAPSDIHSLDLSASASLKELAKKIGLKYMSSPASLPFLLCAHAVIGKSFVTFFPSFFNRKRIFHRMGKMLTLTGYLFLVLGISILARTISLSNQTKRIKTRFQISSQDRSQEKVLHFSTLEQSRVIQLMNAVSSLKREPHPFSFLNAVGPLLRPEWAFKQIKWNPNRAEITLTPNSPKATLKSLNRLEMPGYATSVHSLDGIEVQLTCCS